MNESTLTLGSVALCQVDAQGVLRRCYTQRPGSDRAATMLRTWDTWDFADDVEGRIW